MGSVGFCMKEMAGALYGLKSRQFPRSGVG